MTVALPAMALPLVIDLDGTLIRTDLLQESALKLLRSAPHLALAMPLWLADGKASLKRQIARRVDLDVAHLPFDEALVDWVCAERATGRRTVLCTASDARYADAVAQHLGLFDEVIASDGQTNVSAERKAEALVKRFGEQGFDYAGNSRDDLSVWARAHAAIVVGAPADVRAQARQRFAVVREFDRTSGGIATWRRALRLHQWLKNLLLFLPLAGAHLFFNPMLLAKAVLAFIVFGLCASSVYLLNDLMDLESDRLHPRKRLRPFASGALAPGPGLAAAATLLIASFVFAQAVTPAFVTWLAVYFSLTLAYTFFLKRRVLVDCLALGALYTLRIIAGCAAVTQPASFWLLAFSLFFFLSLAFVKRYSELLLLVKAGREDAHGRGYLAADVSLVQTMGIASGYTAVMLMALYINGDTVQRLYSHPEALWLAIPITLYWISRIWMQAHRGNLDDDPVLFALRDRYSLACGVLFVAVAWTAR